MLHTMLTRKAILVAGCLCLAASLAAQTVEKSQEGPASAVKQELTVPKASVANVASIAAMPASQANATASVREVLSTDRSWVRVEPGVLSLAMRNDPTVAPPTMRYGAAPAIVSLSFGRK